MHIHVCQCLPFQTAFADNFFDLAIAFYDQSQVLTVCMCEAYFAKCVHKKHVCCNIIKAEMSS